MATSFSHDFVAADPNLILEQVIHFSEVRCTTKINEHLCKDSSDAEIAHTLHQIGPGPDGFPELFQRNWVRIKAVMIFCRNYDRWGELTESSLLAPALSFIFFLAKYLLEYIMVRLDLVV